MVDGRLFVGRHQVWCHDCGGEEPSLPLREENIMKRVVTGHNQDGKSAFVSIGEPLVS